MENRDAGGEGRKRALASEIAPAASTSVQSVSAGLLVVSVYETCRGNDRRPSLRCPAARWRRGSVKVVPLAPRQDSPTRACPHLGRLPRRTPRTHEAPEGRRHRLGSSVRGNGDERVRRVFGQRPICRVGCRRSTAHSNVVRHLVSAGRHVWRGPATVGAVRGTNRRWRDRRVLRGGSRAAPNSRGRAGLVNAHGLT